MVPRRYRVFLWLGPLLAVSWLTIVLAVPTPGATETIAIGYFFGSLFGQTTLAAAWTAFGPAPLVWRLPLSLTWVAMLVAALGIGWRNEELFILGGCLFGQWAILQLPLWGLALGYGLRLRHIDEKSYGLDRGERQFGIRQLIIVTAIVAAVFGIGRVVSGELGQHFALGPVEPPTFIFLTLAAIVLTLPLLIAALMRGVSLPAVSASLFFIALATGSEIALSSLVLGGLGPPVEDVSAINAFMAISMVTVLGVVRLNGYSLASAKG